MDYLFLSLKIEWSEEKQLALIEMYSIPKFVGSQR